MFRIRFKPAFLIAVVVDAALIVGLAHLVMRHFRW